MIEAINEINEFGWGALLSAIALIICALPTIYESILKFINCFGIETKWSKKAKKESQEICQLRHDVDEIKENRVHDREQSFQIQKDLIDSQHVISESLDKLKEQLNNMQETTDMRFAQSEEKNNKRDRAQLKDKIGQSYRYYHEKGQINDMEFEALEDLIEAYELADGENSFVHETVQKEMYTWTRV